MDKVSERLEDINKTLKNIVKILDKPKSKLDTILEKIVLFVSACGFITFADIIRGWIIGG